MISTSPGELKPVFDAMLANATRICDAKFGILLRDGAAFAPPRSRRAARLCRVRQGELVLRPRP